MHTALLIMAAGIGSRYGGIKQLDEFGPSGEKIIDYTIYDAVRVGFDKIVFVIRRDIEKDFRESVTDRWCGRIPMEFAYQAMDRIPAGFNVPPERKKPWGTGHAILSGREMIRGPFSVVNADDFYAVRPCRRSAITFPVSGIFPTPTTAWSDTGCDRRCPNTARWRGEYARRMKTDT